eukprot:501393-Ditylum_brightwellii.AAC.1
MVRAFALSPNGNEVGGHYFLSLSTGRRLLRNRWILLLLPADIIRQVNQLACRNPQGLIFSDQSGNLLMLQDDEDDPASEEDLCVEGALI